MMISKTEVEFSLAEEGMSLDNYSDTILGFVHNGEYWVLCEDSLDEKSAEQWGKTARGYGEVVGFYHHAA